MKRKLISRNKKMFSKMTNQHFYSTLRKSISGINIQNRKNMIKKEDHENAFFILGRLVTKIMVPIIVTSPVKRSRVKNKCYSSLSVGTIDDLNKRYSTNYTLDDIKQKNIYWDTK